MRKLEFLGWLTLSICLAVGIFASAWTLGRMTGQGEGYKQCRMDTEFPTRGELDNFIKHHYGD